MAHALGLIAHLCASNSSVLTSISKWYVIAKSNRSSLIASIIRIFKSSNITDKCKAVNKSVIWSSSLALSSGPSPCRSSTMHTPTWSHSSPPHPLAAFDDCTCCTAAICGHARFHLTECGYLQNYSSFSCRTVSALITISIAWGAFLSIYWILWIRLFWCISHLSPNILIALIYCFWLCRLVLLGT